MMIWSVFRVLVLRVGIKKNECQHIKLSTRYMRHNAIVQTAIVFHVTQFTSTYFFATVVRTQILVNPLTKFEVTRLST